jgi:PAS domain S-box-containing protein
MKGTGGKAETTILLSLKDSKFRYWRLFETARDGILILDAETGAITDVNPFLINLLGYSRKGLVHKFPETFQRLQRLVSTKIKSSSCQAFPRRESE